MTIFTYVPCDVTNGELILIIVIPSGISMLSHGMGPLGHKELIKISLEIEYGDTIYMIYIYTYKLKAIFFNNNILMTQSIISQLIIISLLSDNRLVII